MKVRRDRPSFLARSSPIWPIKYSTFFCLGVCRRGMNSSFDTTWVGIGESTPFLRSLIPFGIHIASLPFKDELNAEDDGQITTSPHRYWPPWSIDFDIGFQRRLRDENPVEPIRPQSRTTLPRL